MELGALQSEAPNEGDQDEPFPAGETHCFDWQNRWLKGHEYAFILKNIDAYCAKYGFIKFDFKTHPPSIYQNPVSKCAYDIDGMIYFVKGTGVGSDFGFPRVAKKKKYRWKKMNFTTDLPKQSPHVTYVVASAMKCQAIQNQTELPNFRMHAVIPYKDRLKQYSKPPQFILCHVRKVEKKKLQLQQNPLQHCVSHSTVDFYKLFLTLHNLSLNNQKPDNFSL